MGKVSEKKLMQWHKNILTCETEYECIRKSIIKRKIRLIKKIMKIAKTTGISQLEFGEKDIINKYFKTPIVLIDFSICDKEAYVIETGYLPVNTCLAGCTNNRLVRILNYVESFNNGF